MRRCALIVLLLATAQAAGGNDRFEVVSSHFLPPEHYVGDIVELRLRIAPEDGVVPAEPTSLPAPGAIVIREVRVFPVGRQYDIRVSFSHYELGTAVLPVLVLGDIELRDIAIQTVSVRSGNGEQFAQTLGPVVLPGTALLLALAVGAVLVGPILVITLVAWSRRLYTVLQDLRRERRPLKLLERTLSELSESEEVDVDGREFYIRLADALRLYLSARMGHDFAAETSSEMSRIIMRDWSEVGDMGKLPELITDFDGFKFGGLVPPHARRRSDIDIVRAAAVSLEKYEAEQES